MSKISRKRQSGFTIIEILVVIVILGILATTVTVSVIGYTDEAKITRARFDIGELEKSLELYKIQNGHYPTTEQGLNALVNRPASQPVPRNWKKDGYIKRLEKDPWGNDYQYLQPGVRSAVDVFSYGADGRPGGDEDNADIGNWNS